MITTRQSILVILCLLTSIGAYLLTPHNLLADIEPVNLEQMVPQHFGDWHALPQNDNVVVSAEQDAFIKSIYSQVLNRVYVDNAGHHIMLSIAYTRDQSDNSGTQSHKPEICYPAQGFQIVTNREDIVGLDSFKLPVRRLVAVHGLRIEPITYWTMVGHQPGVTSMINKLNQIQYSIRGIIPDGLIFRISTIGSKEQSEYQLHDLFIKNLSNILSKTSKSRIIGQ